MSPRTQPPNLPSPDVILFDMDDTLVDTTGSYRTATVLTAAHFGVQLSLSDVSRAKAAGDANDEWKLTWRLIKETNPEITLEQITGIYEELYHGNDQQVGLKASEKLLLAPEQLRTLGERHPLGIVTGRPRRDAMYLLNHFDIASLFQVVVTFDDGPLKPDPYPVRLASERLGAKHPWMLGDTPDDMRAAARAGATPIGVFAPSDDKAAAQKALRAAGAVIVLDKISDLFELL